MSIDGLLPDSNTDMARAVSAAESSFREYACLPGNRRALFLREIAASIEALGPHLIDVVCQETYLPQARVQSERGRTCTQLRMFADLAESSDWMEERIDPPDRNRQPTPRPRVRSLLRPVGPVAVFGASNFPLAFSVAGGDTAAALAVGCPVVFKVHPAHPRTSRLVAESIRAATARMALPSGVFCAVELDNSAAQDLVQHPGIRAVAFTGSQRIGLALLRAVQSRPHPIPFFAEMGSVNPVFVFPEAIERQGPSLAQGLAGSITGSVGQLCTQPGLIFLLDDASSRSFLEQLAGIIRETAGGRMLTPAIQTAFQQLVQRRTAVHGVRAVASSDGSSGTSATLHVSDAEVFLRSPELQEEIFGPATLAVLCGSAQEMMTCATSLAGQLTATVWAGESTLPDIGDLLWILEQKAGRIILNGFPTGVELGTAMVHGGPFPATTDSRFTSVGTRAIHRFVRPIAWQTPT